MTLKFDNGVLLKEFRPQGLNDSLITFLGGNVIPQYDKFDKGHRRDHVYDVILNSLKLCKEYKLNYNIAYTAASYHDTGLIVDREYHHLHSAEIVRNDSIILQEWFTPEEIEIIARACADHRASSTRTPRTIYGKIVSDADRTFNLYKMIERAYHFHTNLEPNAAFDIIFNQVYQHLTNKYGKNGYVKLHLMSSKKLYKDELKKIYHAIDNEDIIKNIMLKLS